VAGSPQIGECSESHRDGHAGIQSPNAVEKIASAPPTPLPDAGRGFPAARSSTSVPAADTPTHSSCRKKKRHGDEEILQEGSFMCPLAGLASIPSHLRNPIA